MKKLFLSSVFLLLFPILSCIDNSEELKPLQKIEVQSEKIDPITLNKRVSSLTSSFISSQSLPQINRPPRRKVFEADWQGAASGGIVGWIVGSGFAGVGGAIGGIIGAISGGAAASLAAVEVPDNDTIVLPQPDSQAFAAPNPNNPYDYIGYYHYKVLNEALKDSTRYLDAQGNFSNTNFYNFSTSYLVQENIFNTNALTAFSISDSQNNLLFIESYKNQPNASPMIIQLYNDGKMSLSVKNVLSSYAIAVAASTNVNDFIQYSVKVENTIASSNLSIKEQQLLLGTMATARYGIHYWGL